ncbi:hypothetical protein LBMAG34_1370 [Candidatus Saccharibacteria bacterium]|nr:hypothetical protein LBMAG34_1370 [Candidatus Saccharibacteria bacterium]
MRRALREVWFKVRFKLFGNSEAEWWYKVNQNRKNADFSNPRSDLRPSMGKLAPTQEPDSFIDIDEESAERVFFEEVDELINSGISENDLDEKLLDLAEELSLALEAKKLADSETNESLGSYFEAMHKFGY